MDTNQASRLCRLCYEKKHEREFYRRKNVSGGRRSHCKACEAGQNNARRSGSEVKARRAEHARAYRQSEAYQKQRDRKKDKKKEKKRLYMRKRRNSSPETHISDALTRRMTSSVKRIGFILPRATIEDRIGISTEGLFSYITPLIPGGYGLQDYAEFWVLDHSCPIAQARNLEEAMKLLHFTNLMPMLTGPNAVKGAKRTPLGEELCLRLLGREFIDPIKKETV